MPGTHVELYHSIKDYAKEVAGNRLLVMEQVTPFTFCKWSSLLFIYLPYHSWNPRGWTRCELMEPFIVGLIAVGNPWGLEACQDWTGRDGTPTRPPVSDWGGVAKVTAGRWWPGVVPPVFSFLPLSLPPVISSIIRLAVFFSQSLSYVS